MSLASAARRSITDLFPSAWESTGMVKVLNPVNIFRHLTGQNDDIATQPTTVVGVTRASGSIGDTDGLGGIIYLLAAVNVFIGVFNMFPLLPFDGGHAAIATYERIREGRVRPALLRRRRQDDAADDGRHGHAVCSCSCRLVPRRHQTAAVAMEVSSQLTPRRVTKQIHVG